MNKQDLVKSVSSKVEGATQKDITVIIDVLIETIKETVSNNEKVFIAGFGTFNVTERAERQARNPRTGEVMNIKASRAPKFKAGKAFKNYVNS